MEVDYKTEVEGDRGVIIVTGDFDNEQAGEALRLAANRLLDSDIQALVLDMTDVQIINEYGLGKMLALQKRLIAEEKMLLVKPLTGFVGEVIDLLMLSDLFPVDDGSSLEALAEKNPLSSVFAASASLKPLGAAPIAEPAEEPEEPEETEN